MQHVASAYTSTYNAQNHVSFKHFGTFTLHPQPSILTNCKICSRGCSKLNLSYISSLQNSCKWNILQYIFDVTYCKRANGINCEQRVVTISKYMFQNSYIHLVEIVNIFLSTTKLDTGTLSKRSDNNFPQ